ncbi:MAG: YraN family protein [Oscillospiraceae bacterium]
MNNQENIKKTGSFGEEYTLNHLIENGYKIIEKNYHSRYGEIDIIACKNSYIAFVEVKTRNEDFLYSPVFAVTKSKQNKIIKTAIRFLQDNNEFSNLQPRFDVCEIVIENNKKNQVKNLNYIENAFWVVDNNRYF